MQKKYKLIYLLFKHEEFDQLCLYLTQTKDIRKISFLDADEEFLFKILKLCESMLQSLTIQIYLLQPIDFTQKYKVRSIIKSIKKNKNFRWNIIEKYHEKSLIWH